MQGGIALVRNNKVIESLPLPIAGLMSDQNGRWVMEKLERINKVAFQELGVNPKLEPVSPLCFMALPVIPELKLTDKGLFDVVKFEFTEILES